MTKGNAAAIAMNLNVIKAIPTENTYWSVTVLMKFY